MAVPQNIIDLIHRALQDAVLTHNERKNIVRTAINQGVDKDEINDLMDEMFAQRLKSYTKEKLKRCPSCGAQIPLLSDDCFYCGEQLTVRESARPVETKRHTVKEEAAPNTCPDCGAQFPMISNICPYCGHVHHAQYDSEVNVYRLMESIDRTTQDLIDAPAPVTSFLGKYVRFLCIIMLCITLPLNSALYDVLPGIVRVLLCLGLLILGIPFIVLIVNDSASSNEASAEEKQYLYARLEYNKYLRYVNAFYGDNDEAREYLKKLDAAVRKIERKRKFAILKRIAIAVIVLILPFVPDLLDIPAKMYLKGLNIHGFSFF
jgi:hypothetical protein